MAYFITEACTGCTACARICPTTAISGTRAQLHVIDPEVCIGCGVCGRVCPAAAVLNEEKQPCQSIKRSNWVKPSVRSETCVSCGACIQACPVDALAWDVNHVLDENLLPYLKDQKACISCSFCAAACPVEAIEMKALEPV
jgi:Na+-translocating ferredoxin:NAD+ oxidoreductase subunit B